MPIESTNSSETRKHPADSNVFEATGVSVAVGLCPSEFPDESGSKLPIELRRKTPSKTMIVVRCFWLRLVQKDLIASIFTPQVMASSFSL